MFGIGTGELLLLLVLALLVLGPERMPKVARDVGRTINDLRRTSDELRSEFLNADQLLERAVKTAERADEPVAVAAAAEPPPDAGATQADVVAPSDDHDETEFDREARAARERLGSSERADQAKREGWQVPTDEAGSNTDRWG